MRVERCPREQLARKERVDTRPEQHLGAIDVADTGEDRLVHEQGRDRLAGPVEPQPGSFPIGLWVEGVRAGRGAYRRCLLGRDQLARLRSGQVVHARFGGSDPEPHLSRTARPWERAQLADQPQVDMDDAVTRELDEQVLSHGPRTLDDGPVEQLGGICEPTLGA